MNETLNTWAVPVRELKASKPCQNLGVNEWRILHTADRESVSSSDCFNDIFERWVIDTMFSLEKNGLIFSQIESQQQNAKIIA